MRYAIHSAKIAFSLVVACSTAVTSSATESTTSDVLGSPDVANAADTSCNVILRNVHTNQNRGGVETNCVGNPLTCWVVFSGEVDISAEAVREGALPFVYYQSGSDPNWYTAPTLMTTDAGTGMERFKFDLIANTALNGTQYPTIQVIPFLKTVVGTRIFDHNNSVNNYVLDQNNNWNMGDNGTHCYAPPPVSAGYVSFPVGWNNTLGGKLVNNGKLQISYDIHRMPQCIGLTTDGVEAWNTEAYVLFSPGHQSYSRSVRGSIDWVTNQWQGELYELDIPSDAQSVSMWFHTSGDGCNGGWDSNYGENFNYPVSSTP